MKNFLLFIYDFEYPKGGFRDFVGAFPTEKKAHKSAKQQLLQKAKKWRCNFNEVEANYHIFHISSRNIISSSQKRTPLKSVKTKGI